MEQKYLPMVRVSRVARQWAKTKFIIIILLISTASLFVSGCMLKTIELKTKEAVITNHTKLSTVTDKTRGEIRFDIMGTRYKKGEVVFICHLTRGDTLQLTADKIDEIRTAIQEGEEFSEERVAELKSVLLTRNILIKPNAKGFRFYGESGELACSTIDNLTFRKKLSDIKQFYYSMPETVSADELKRNPSLKVKQIVKKGNPVLLDVKYMYSMQKSNYLIGRTSESEDVIIQEENIVSGTIEVIDVESDLYVYGTRLAAVGAVVGLIYLFYDSIIFDRPHRSGGR